MMPDWIKSKLRNAEKEVQREPQTHDYRKMHWGHSIEYRVDGMTLQATGWGDGIRNGDCILIAHSRGEGRYQVESINYFTNPSDMWSAKLVFAPRPVEEKGGVA